jgi:hypothetical protein
MALDLEKLRKEMQAYLEKAGTPIFYGYHHMLDSLIQVSWDTERHPDFREFLETGRQSGAKLVVFNQEAFQLDQIDEALEELETADFTREEKRSFETRLKQLQAYEGFTCLLQLSFALENRLYLFEVRTDWYDSMRDILSELEMAADPFTGDEDEEEEHGPIGGGYFSNN